MKTDEIIQEILRGKQEEEILKILTEIIIEQKNNYRESDMERRASLLAIRKINNGKNEAIDALCDENNRYSGRRKHHGNL